MASTGTPPWRPTLRMQENKEKNAPKQVQTATIPENSCVISRNALQAYRTSCMGEKPMELQEPYCLRSTEILKSSTIKAPPGLEHIAPAVPLPMRSLAPPKAQPVVEATEEFRVLLTNLPEMMLQECSFKVMLEQAKLDKAVGNLAFRPGGKALVSLKTKADAIKCIEHFRGRQWGQGAPVVATYVTLVNSGKKPAEEVKPAPVPIKLETAPITALSKDAPTFTPTWLAKPLSAEAPTFVPSFMRSEDKVTEKTRPRVWSNASTDAGLASTDEGSEGCESETEAVAMCT